jgi:hypothetical protein
MMRHIFFQHPTVRCQKSDQTWLAPEDDALRYCLMLDVRLR